MPSKPILHRIPRHGPPSIAEKTAAGVAPPLTPSEDVEDEFPEGLSPVEFTKLDYRRAIAVVERAQMGDRLDSYFLAEMERARGPRATVLEAFKERGYEFEDKDEEDGEEVYRPTE